MKIKRYDKNLNFINEFTILDPYKFKETESLILRSTFEKSEVSIMTYDEKSKLNVELEWINLTASELSTILEVINAQNDYLLTFTYNDTEYFIRFSGPFIFTLETVEKIYSFKTEIFSIGVKE